MTERNYGIDLLKVVACLGVVILHVTMGTFELSQPFNVSAYLYYLGTFSIPLFFMINGYFLLNKPNLIYPYLFKKINSILLITSFWTLLYWVLKADFAANPLKKIGIAFLQRGYFFQFWFFGSLTIIYLLLPFLHSWLQAYRRHLYLTFFLLGLGVIIQSLNFQSLPVSFPIPIQSQVA